MSGLTPAGAMLGATLAIAGGVGAAYEGAHAFSDLTDGSSVEQVFDAQTYASTHGHDPQVTQQAEVRNVIEHAAGTGLGFIALGAGAVILRRRPASH